MPKETARVGRRSPPLLIRLYIQSWLFLASCSPLRCRVLDRPPGSDNGETDDLPPESLSRMPPHDGLTNGWAESSSTVSERWGRRVWATMDQTICHRVVFRTVGSYLNTTVGGAGFTQRGNERFPASALVVFRGGEWHYDTSVGGHGVVTVTLGPLGRPAAAPGFCAGVVGCTRGRPAF
jgi:hypothetical protein